MGRRAPKNLKKRQRSNLRKQDATSSLETSSNTGKQERHPKGRFPVALTGEAAAESRTY